MRGYLTYPFIAQVVTGSAQERQRVELISRRLMRYVHATDPGKRRAVEAAARVSKVERLASPLPHKKTATR